MPAILRESLPNLLASQLYSQSYPVCDVVVGGARRALDPVYSPDRVCGVCLLPTIDVVPDV